MKETTLQDYKARMTRVLVHIQQRLDDELSLDDLADLAAFSPYHFHRIFRGMLGESVQAHIRRLRLERAAMRLKHGNRRIIDIALEAGYDSHEAFTRAFKTMTDLAPSDFRSRAGAAYRSEASSGVQYTDDGRIDDFVPGRGGESMEVHLKTLEPMRVAFVRHVGAYQDCGQAWDRLVPWLGKEGLLGPGVRFFGVCHDDPEVTPAERLRYDACVTVEDDFRPEGEIGVQTLVGGEYAVTTHFGPYNRLGATYADLLGQWLPRSGRELRSLPCLEEYLNSPEDNAPEDLITDVYAPLEPR